MISRLLPGLGLLIPLVVFASAGEESSGEAGSLKAWSVEALCSARERAEVRDELKHRDIFSPREMRVLRSGEVQTGISLETLICLKGSPSRIVDFGRMRYGTVAAYVHERDGSLTSASYVFEGDGETLVVVFLESENVEAIVQDPAYRVSCDPTAARPTRCRLVHDEFASGVPGGSSPRRTSIESREERRFCGERPCDADVTNRNPF